MEFKRFLNEYLIEDIFRAIIFRSVPQGTYLIVIMSLESGEVKKYDNIESVPTFGMIENFIKLDFNYGK